MYGSFGYPDLTKTISPSDLSNKQNGAGYASSQILCTVYERLLFSNHNVSELVKGSDYILKVQKKAMHENSFDLFGGMHDENL